MCRLTALLAAILLLLAAVGCADSSDSLERVLGSGRLRFGVAPEDRPMSFDWNGEPAGLSVELAKEFAKRLNVEAQFVFVEHSDAQRALEEDEIDVYVNLPSPGQKAEATMLTLDGGMDCRQIVVVPAESKINRLYDLEGGTLAVLTGSEASDALDEAEVFKKALGEVTYCELPADQLAAINGGTADAMLIGEPLYRYIMIGTGSEYRVLDNVLADTRFIHALRLHDTTLGERIGSLFADMEKDGTFESIRKEWLG